MENDLLDKKLSRPLTIYHNHPELASGSNQRTSSCMIINKHIKHVDNDEIGVMEIQSGLYGVIHFEIYQSDYSKACILFMENGFNPAVIYQEIHFRLKFI